jgi:hypothetical protein
MGGQFEFGRSGQFQLGTTSGAGTNACAPDGVWFSHLWQKLSELSCVRDVVSEIDLFARVIAEDPAVSAV